MTWDDDGDAFGDCGSVDGDVGDFEPRERRGELGADDPGWDINKWNQTVSTVPDKMTNAQARALIKAGVDAYGTATEALYWLDTIPGTGDHKGAETRVTGKRYVLDNRLPDDSAPNADPYKGDGKAVKVETRDAAVEANAALQGLHDQGEHLATPFADIGGKLAQMLADLVDALKTVAAAGHGLLIAAGVALVGYGLLSARKALGRRRRR